jgi:hypothetical protein
VRSSLEAIVVAGDPWFFWPWEAWMASACYSKGSNASDLADDKREAFADPTKLWEGSVDGDFVVRRDTRLLRTARWSPWS